MPPESDLRKHREIDMAGASNAQDHSKVVPSKMKSLDSSDATITRSLAAGSEIIFKITSHLLGPVYWC